MRSKIDFYRIYFEQLAQRGFHPRRSESADYIADIYHKGKLIAYFSKADTIAPCSQAQLLVKEKEFSKLINQIQDIAQISALKAGICTECPYTDQTEKMPNGWYKLSEYQRFTLAAREHHLFGYVFNTYQTNPTGEPENRRVFYNRESAAKDFAIRSGLIDERTLFSESELRLLHACLLYTSRCV